VAVGHFFIGAEKFCRVIYIGVESINIGYVYTYLSQIVGGING
jgi:hypothetical protein